MKKNVIERPNKTRLLNGLLAITLIAPAVFQSTTPAASKRTPTRTYYLFKIFSKISLISTSLIEEASGRISSTIFPISTRRFV